MKRVGHLIDRIRKTLQRPLARIDHFPPGNAMSARCVWQERLGLEPVLEIMHGRKGTFWGIFYVLDRRFVGQHGICSDDICVRHHVQWGSIDSLLPHIGGTLSWFESLAENPFHFPRERFYDAVSDILGRISPSCLAHGWYRYYTEAGTFEQFVTFNEVNGVEGSLEAAFGKEHWYIFFELVSCGDRELSPLERQQTMTFAEFTPDQADSAAAFISAALARRTLKAVSAEE